MPLKIGPPPPLLLKSKAFPGSTGYYCQFIPQVHTGSPDPCMRWCLVKMQAERRPQSFWMAGASRHLMSWSACSPQCTYSCLHHAGFSSHFKLHNQCLSRYGLGAVLYQTHDDVTDAVTAYALIGTWQWLKPTTPPINWSCSPLRGLWSRNFMNISTDWPLTSALITTLSHVHSNDGKAGRPLSHCWVTRLSNYNFQLYYRVGKTNIDADALPRVFWPMAACLNALGTHYWVTAVAVHTMQEATLEGLIRLQWGIQLQPTHPGPCGGWPTGHPAWPPMSGTQVQHGQALS